MLASRTALVWVTGQMLSTTNPPSTRTCGFGAQNIVAVQHFDGDQMPLEGAEAHVRQRAHPQLTVAPSPCRLLAGAVAACLVQ